MIPYTPLRISTPDRVLGNAPSGWKGLESILGDLVDRFCKGRHIACELGVEFGYSTVALSNFFDHVIGVDRFTGDVHSSIRLDYSDKTRGFLKDFPNITLVKSEWKDFADLQPESVHYDLCHVDIEHSYEETFPCGMWAAQHSDVTIFHDTRSFHEVMRAVTDIAEKTGKEFYEFSDFCGLGILV